MKTFGSMTRFLALLRLARASEIPAEFWLLALFTAVAWIDGLLGETTEKKA